MDEKPSIIVVAGTNASGKSSLGVELALRYGGEIISADSRQVFEGLDLGSGKITAQEMRGVPHHLLDVCKPGAFFSMADFQRLAYEAIDGILQRGKLPFLVGGTGLYIASVVDGYELSGRMPDLSYRRELETLPTETLAAMLLEKLPQAQVDPHNRNRVMRLLERLHDEDFRPQGNNPRYRSLRLGVSWPRDVLEQRIKERLDRRLAEGMLQEVQGLLAQGVSGEFLYKLGLEYRFLSEYLAGEPGSSAQPGPSPGQAALPPGQPGQPLAPSPATPGQPGQPLAPAAPPPGQAEMARLLMIAIRQFAKRQMTWFRRDQEMHWLDMAGNPLEEACGFIDAFLAAGPQGSRPPPA